jgi:uridine kinase
VIGRFAELAGWALAQPPRLGPVRVVAIDGPAGAGKSTFAGRLATALRDAGASTAVVHTDDLLEGWADIVAFWPRLDASVLGPLRRGEPGRYQRYDWVAGRFADETIEVPVPDVLVLEGVSSARAEIRDELVLAVFVTAPEELRLARGLERDGEELRSHWLRWMRDESEHFAVDQTAKSVDILIDGASAITHDRQMEYVAVGGLRRWGRITGEERSGHERAI